MPSWWIKLSLNWPVKVNTKQELFCHDPLLPFVEARYTRSSQAAFKPHMHSTVSVGAVDRGEVIYRVGEESASLKPGSLALINPETLHSCNAPADQGRSYYMLYMDESWCLRLQQSLWQVDRLVPFKRIRLDDVGLYRTYCNLMQEFLGGEMHLQEKEQKLVDLMLELFLRCCSPGEKSPPVPAGIDLLKKLLGEDLHKDFTLDSLADVLGCNPYTVLRRFKAETGITPHAFRMNCRIEQARRLLQQGVDIAEVALLCGFFDQSHLHRHFKAHTTVTPREYKVNFVQSS